MTSGPPLIDTLGLTLAAAGRTLVSDLSWQARAGERWCGEGQARGEDGEAADHAQVLVWVAVESIWSAVVTTLEFIS